MFLRPNATRQITADNIANEVNFMTMDCSGGNLLQGLEMMITKIFAPAIRVQEVLSIYLPRDINYDKLHRTLNELLGASHRYQDQFLATDLKLWSRMTWQFFEICSL